MFNEKDNEPKLIKSKIKGALLCSVLFFKNNEHCFVIKNYKHSFETAWIELVVITDKTIFIYLWQTVNC